jgi:hypothetical protein
MIHFLEQEHRFDNLFEQTFDQTGREAEVFLVSFVDKLKQRRPLLPLEHDVAIPNYRVVSF